MYFFRRLINRANLLKNHCSINACINIKMYGLVITPRYVKCIHTKHTYARTHYMYMFIEYLMGNVILILR